MGYIESYELGMPRKEFQKLYSYWEAELAKSGFNDIEYRSPSHTGHFTPFFRENGSTATFQMLYDPAKQEYYELTRSFDSYMDEVVSFRCPLTLKKRRVQRWTVAFDGKADLYKHLWYLHIEGIPYRAVAKAFSGRQSKWLRNVEPVPPRLIRATASEFWAHDHTNRVLDLFWKWAFDVGYTKDPRDEYVSRKPKKVKSE
jgi:hypothetical protein